MRWTTLTVVATIALLCAWGITTQGPATAGIPAIEVLTSELPVLPGPGVDTGFGKKVAGTYFSRDFPGLEGPAQVLWNITEDGNIVESSGVDQGGPTGTGLIFGNSHGSWVKSGRRSFANTGMLFAFDPATGAHVWNLKINADFHFSDDYQTVDIFQTNAGYGLDQDPFDPDEVPLIFPATDLPPYTARRVNVE